MSILHGAHRADSVNAWLKKRYGVNPHGEAFFRLVVAEEVYQMAGGTYYDWPEGSSVEDRGGMDVGEQYVDGWKDPHRLPMVPQTLMPVRIITEMREVQKYPDLEGWILERWFPAELYGSEEAWLGFKDEGGNPLLGPYPARGEYEVITSAAKHTPSTGRLEQVIAGWFKQREQAHQGTAVSRMQKRVSEALAREEEATRKFKERLTAKLDDATKPLWGSSLESGRLREHYAKKARVSHHVGN